MKHSTQMPWRTRHKTLHFNVLVFYYSCSIHNAIHKCLIVAMNIELNNFIYFLLKAPHIGKWLEKWMEII